VKTMGQMSSTHELLQSPPGVCPAHGTAPRKQGPRALLGLHSEGLFWYFLSLGSSSMSHGHHQHVSHKAGLNTWSAQGGGGGRVEAKAVSLCLLPPTWFQCRTDT